MAHLVDSFVARDGAYRSLESYFDEIRKAQGYLSQYGVETFQKAAALEGGEHWGVKAKRIKVEFPTEPRPALIAPGIEDHSLAEVVNQCATMERLLDALHWAQREPSLEGYVVERCHPTTGSSKGDDDDHDLVLVEKDAPERKAKFEVSDAAGAKDGNNKEKKDLASLGVLEKGSFRSSGRWPDGRLFLVVSEEFGKRLTGRRVRNPHHSYAGVGHVNSTRIVEIVQGER